MSPLARLTLTLLWPLPYVGGAIGLFGWDATALMSVAWFVRIVAFGGAAMTRTAGGERVLWIFTFLGCSDLAMVAFLLTRVWGLVGLPEGGAPAEPALGPLLDLPRPPPPVPVTARVEHVGASPLATARLALVALDEAVNNEVDDPAGPWTDLIAVHAALHPLLDAVAQRLTDLDARHGALAARAGMFEALADDPALGADARASLGRLTEEQAALGNARARLEDAALVAARKMAAVASGLEGDDPTDEVIAATAALVEATRALDDAATT